MEFAKRYIENVFTILTYEKLPLAEFTFKTQFDITQTTYY